MADMQQQHIVQANSKLIENWELPTSEYGTAQLSVGRRYLHHAAGSPRRDHDQGLSLPLLHVEINCLRFPFRPAF
jgi:hypothetical protein